ncbi:MAG: ribbon-helix-helix protein, CopG family [Candidatus Competibacteraceae bacterium]|nr:MAG: ribbon-helix-helix protein, CopG family [Candidatus Competibacteraceae bacterium]
MTTAAFTIRTDPDTLQRLDQLAKQLDRSRNYLANQALEEFLELQAWQIGKVQAGIAAAERGEFAADGEMERLFAKYPKSLQDTDVAS